MKIGFIGLGNMGAPMVANLLKAAQSVSVFDINPQAIAAAVANGAIAANSRLLFCRRHASNSPSDFNLPVAKRSAALVAGECKATSTDRASPWRASATPQSPASNATEPENWSLTDY